MTVFLGLDVCELVLKVGHLGGQDPGLGEKIVVILKVFFHSHQITAQVILSRKLIHSSKVIYALVVLKLGELFGKNSLGVIPKDVPIGCFIVC
jgi:hypothetical protein